jgi:hypothetical protein
MIPDQVPSPGPNVQGNLPNGGAVPETCCDCCGTVIGPSSAKITNQKGAYCSMGCAGSADNMPDDTED